eukprot:4292805-Prymnesium_polylepis.1
MLISNHWHIRPPEAGAPWDVAAQDLEEAVKHTLARLRAGAAMVATYRNSPHTPGSASCAHGARMQQDAPLFRTTLRQNFSIWPTADVLIAPHVATLTCNLRAVSCVGRSE